jgi:N utilization substance protein B
VLHQILRLAAFELKFLKDVPVKTVIGEYLEITASFFDEKKISFANGVLESVARKFRKEEFLKIKENE